MKKRIFALLLCVMLCAAMAFSYAFIALKSEHDCTAGHCQVCAELQICHSLIRNLSYAGAALSVFVWVAYFSANLSRSLPEIIKINTLVSLKVKLLN